MDLKVFIQMAGNSEIQSDCNWQCFCHTTCVIQDTVFY